MKILALNAYYEPEIASSIYLSTNLYEDIANSGHIVELHTPMPTRGINKTTRNSYKNKKIEYKCEGNLVINRFSLYREGNSTFKRFLRYTFSNLILIWRGINSNADIIFSHSTPPTQGAISSIIKYFTKKPFVYSLQDIFPNSLVNSGMTKESSFIWKIGIIIEKFTYKNADKIIVISEDFKIDLLKKGVSSDKIEVVPNWVDENAVKPIKKSKNLLFDKYNLDKSKFYISYSGNIGFSQNLDLLMEVAKELMFFDNIHFIIVGDGAYKNELEILINKMNLSNITLLPFQPYELISQVFSLGDIGLIISKANIGKNSIPSKTWSIMSAEKPILASFDVESDLCKSIYRAECGLCIEPNNKVKLKNAIIQMYEQKESMKIKGKSGRKFVMENLTRKAGTTKYLNIIESVLK